MFAMANPDPEIRPEEADGVAAVMATGRSDFPNQINNVLCFPGIFRGALDAGATDHHREHEAGRGRRHRLGGRPRTSCAPDFVIPSVFDRRVGPMVAAAAAEAAVRDGVCRPR